MYDACAKIDARIERYRKIADPVIDPLTRERVSKVIEDLKAEKAKLHPEDESKR